MLRIVKLARRRLFIMVRIVRLTRRRLFSMLRIVRLTRRCCVETLRIAKLRMRWRHLGVKRSIFDSWRSSTRSASTTSIHLWRRGVVACWLQVHRSAILGDVGSVSDYEPNHPSRADPRQSDQRVWEITDVLVDNFPTTAMADRRCCDRRGPASFRSTMGVPRLAHFHPCDRQSASILDLAFRHQRWTNPEMFRKRSSSHPS